jgi:hypothetical protein
MPIPSTRMWALCALATMVLSGRPPPTNDGSDSGPLTVFAPVP